MNYLIIQITSLHIINIRNFSSGNNKIKTGFLYSQPVINGEKINHFKVPAHLGYIASSSYIIRPSISIGVITPSYSGGLAFRFNENINIGIQSWFNFDREAIPLIPTSLLNYSILGNLYIQF